MARKEAYSPVWQAILLSLITFGIYMIYWCVTRKRFLNKKGAKIPTAWLLIIPVVNLYWLYKLCEGWAKVCKQQNSGKWLAFILWLFIAFISVALMQDEINRNFYPRA